jgi:ribonuclease P protein component
VPVAPSWPLAVARAASSFRPKPPSLLARANRLTDSEQFRSAIKSGRRFGSNHLVIYLKRDETSSHARFGFIVGKTVAGAVGRNLVKRRLRALAREVLAQHPGGFDLVVRAQTGAAELDWNRLREEFLGTAENALSKVFER